VALQRIYAAQCNSARRNAILSNNLAGTTKRQAIARSRLPIREAVMTEQWKPSFRIWPFADAPEEFRRLWPADTDYPPELVIYVPSELVEAVECPTNIPPALWFLAFPPKRPGMIQTASEGFGDYSLHLFPRMEAGSPSPMGAISTRHTESWRERVIEPIQQQFGIARTNPSHRPASEIARLLDMQKEWARTL
jgi:hypothetical protein